mgnify:CR=1 FL=1
MDNNNQKPNINQIISNALDTNFEEIEKKECKTCNQKKKQNQARNKFHRFLLLRHLQTSVLRHLF